MHRALCLVLLAGCSSASAPTEALVLAPEREAPPAREAYVETIAPPDEPGAVITGVFENASAVCNDWTTEGATAIRSIPPRSGDYACKVCATGEASEIVLGRQIGGLRAGRYVLTAYVRRRTATPGPSSARVELDVDGIVTSSLPVVLGDDAYALAQVTVVAPTRATSLRARVVAEATGSQCLFVDDVTVVREPL